jgi:hypothetical protein
MRTLEFFSLFSILGLETPYIERCLATLSERLLMVLLEVAGTHSLIDVLN